MLSKILENEHKIDNYVTAKYLSFNGDGVTNDVHYA